MIYRANQLTGFYMRATMALNEINFSNNISRLQVSVNMREPEHDTTFETS